MATKAKIGVLGASGYTGSELVRLLLRHPRAEIAMLTADRRAGQADAQRVSAVLAVRSAERWSPSTTRTGARPGSRSRLLRAAACDDAEGAQGSAGQGAGYQGGRPLGRFSAERHSGLCALVLATSITRRNCRRRRCTASPRSTSARSRRRGWSPIPAATRPARNCR